MEYTKKKICHISSTDITVRYLLMPQLKFLVSQGFAVHAVCSPGTLEKEIEREGIRLQYIAISRKLFTPFADMVSLIKLYRYFKKEKFDIVHTHAPKPALLGQLAAKLAGVPIIINTVHGLYFTEDSSWLRSFIFILIEKISAACSTLIFSQNKEDIETMVAKRITPRRKIQYLGNGIDMVRFNLAGYNPEIIAEKKRELGLPENTLIIGTVGRLVKEKGYFDMFSALQTVIKKYPHVLFIAVGPEDHEKHDRFSPAVIAEYALEKHMVFLGERKDVEALYPLMDLFVFASHREGFPRSVIEAMAMERPIVVTDIRGCREEIDQQKNGLMVPVRNPEKLAEAIIWLLENPQKAREFAAQAGIKARAEFDERIVFEKIKNAYELLLSPKN